MIRAFKPSDINDILGIWLKASIEAHGFAGREFWESRIDDMRDKYLPHSDTYVFTDNDIVKGFFSLHGGTLAAMFVSPDFQGEGIGRKLLDKAKSLRNKLVLTAYRDNPGSVRFYRKNGFVIAGERVDELTGHVEILMEYGPRAADSADGLQPLIDTQASETVMIREATINDCEVLAGIIRNSFRDVARRFSLTEDNCPTHPSNYTSSRIESDILRGIRYFILYMDENPTGCVGIENPDTDVCYLERLSVLPEMRGRHFGIRLVLHALDCAASKGADRVSIGIIAEHTELKEWYESLGFVETQIKSFPHLPFKVCMMEIRKSADNASQPYGAPAASGRRR